MILGKIVKSDSHINYVCQISGPYEVEVIPGPEEYTFGQFVQIAVHSKQAENDQGRKNLSQIDSLLCTTTVVGVIYDTILLNPAFGSVGPRLSTETQVELFSPDYISEKAVLISIIVLGMIEQRISLGGVFERIFTKQGIPLLSLELGSEVETMTDEEVRSFHFFSNHGASSNQTPYLHLGYLPHMIAQSNSLMPLVILRIIDQLEFLFPQSLTLLSIVKNNLAWRLKIETTG